jgi:SsrA-binding protein
VSAKPTARKGESKEEIEKVLLRNKKARHDYFVEDTVEAGMVLLGSEVKSLREARAVMTDAYVFVKNGEAFLSQLQITEYPWANRWNHEPKRERKLLLHRREIDKLGEAAQQQGYTLLPLEIYLKRGRIKALIGVCRGKKLHDKRATEKRRDAEREMAAAMRRARR